MRKGAFSALEVGRDCCWEVSQEERGECFALVIVFLSMSHKCLLGGKEAFRFNVWYFSPWAAFSMWESGTWIRLTAEDNIKYFILLTSGFCLLYGSFSFNVFHIFSPKDWGEGNGEIKCVAKSVKKAGIVAGKDDSCNSPSLVKIGKAKKTHSACFGCADLMRERGKTYLPALFPR